MRYLKSLVLFMVLLALPALHSQAQVAIRVGVNIGPSYGVYHAPPVCEWGFYPAYPFGCAPYGYYGPEWFADGVFIGAGPWYNFYYVRPAYYRPYYFRSVWYVHRFHDRDRFFFRDARFHDRGFREFRRHEFHEHDFDRGRRFDHGHDFDRGHRSHEFHDHEFRDHGHGWGRGHEGGNGHGKGHGRRD